MATKRLIQVPHWMRLYKLTEKEEEAVRKIQEALGPQNCTWLEAKKAWLDTESKEVIEARANAEVQKVAEQNGVKLEKKPMTIAETKLGVTLVLSKEDCKLLGFDLNMATKEALVLARIKLGLPQKSAKRVI